MQQIKWLWSLMAPKDQKKEIFALIVSAVTTAMLLINPSLTATLVDEVIIGMNTEPLLRILMMMLFFQLTRLGLRYFMIVTLEHNAQNTILSMRTQLFSRLQYQEMTFFDHNRTGDLMTRMSADLDWCRHFISYLSYAIVDNIVIFIAASAIVGIVFSM